MTEPGVRVAPEVQVVQPFQEVLRRSTMVWNFVNGIIYYYYYPPATPWLQYSLYLSFLTEGRKPWVNPPPDWCCYSGIGFEVTGDQKLAYAGGGASGHLQHYLYVLG